MHSETLRVGEHRAASVNDITCRDLLVAGLRTCDLVWPSPCPTGRSMMEKTVPLMLTFVTPSLLEPSSGSNNTIYLPASPES